MDFARRQLEKYGWTDGKGLGKNENGISEALKPKLKRSVAGIGHDPASDFTEHWWTTLYDKAAKNLEVEQQNGKTKKIKTKSNDFIITNSIWQLNKKQKGESNNEEYPNFFVKKAVLSSRGLEIHKVKDSSSDDEEPEKKTFNMTDEELFAACEGRTAHKGARFGLKAHGKLARILKQEQIMLSSEKFSSYVHTKPKVIPTDMQLVEDTNLNSDIEISKKKRKKTKKHCKDSLVFDDISNHKTDKNLIKAESDTNTDQIRKNRKRQKNIEKLQDSILDVKLSNNEKNVKLNDSNCNVLLTKNDGNASISDTIIESNSNEMGTSKSKKKKKNKK